MLIRKVSPMVAPVRLSEARLPVDAATSEQRQLVSQVEVTSLQIEQEPDAGSDPYNCTGQFCVVDLAKDK
jgi:hypothetical protein